MGELVDAAVSSSSPEKLAHGGGVYSLSYSKDGRRVMSASADKSCKLCFGTPRLVKLYSTALFYFLHSRIIATCGGRTWSRGEAADAGVEHQQLGCRWQGTFKVSVSLNGEVNYWSDSDPRPTRVVSVKPQFGRPFALRHLFHFLGSSKRRDAIETLDYNPKYRHSSYVHYRQSRWPGVCLVFRVRRSALRSQATCWHRAW